MNELEMNELLEKWAELDPLGAKSIIANRWKLTDDTDAMKSMVIQTLVQEDIVARGWGVRLEFNLKNHCEWIAYIAIPGSRVFVDGGLQDEPAIALLSAYVQALETSQKAGGGSING